MKIKRLSLAWVSAILMMLGTAGCNDEAAIPTPPDIHTVKLSSHYFATAVDEELSITPRFNNPETFAKGFSWTNSDSTVASIAVDPQTLVCKVTTLKVGTTVLRITSEDGSLKDSCIVDVNRQSYMLKAPVYINLFGNADAPWNNIGSYSEGAGLNEMKDINGNPTWVNIKITNAFNWGENDGDPEETIEDGRPITLPNAVSGSAFKNDRKADTGVFEISGLSYKQSYHLAFFASKRFWGDVCSAKITAAGDNRATITLLTKKTSSDPGDTGAAVPKGTAIGGTPAEDNTFIRYGKIKITPDGSGKIIITVTGGEGGNQPDGTSFINAILISPIE